MLCFECVCVVFWILCIVCVWCIVFQFSVMCFALLSHHWYVLWISCLYSVCTSVPPWHPPFFKNLAGSFLYIRYICQRLDLEINILVCCVLIVANVVFCVLIVLCFECVCCVFECMCCVLIVCVVVFWMCLCCVLCIWCNVFGTFEPSLIYIVF